MPGQLRSVRQLAEMIENPRKALADPKYWREPLCHRWLYFNNRRRKGRTRKLLDQARSKFIRLQMDAEAAAVTAELTRHAPEGAVPRLCADILPILSPGPIRDLVEQLRRARVVDRVAIAERLRGLIQGPETLPAALWV
ncbi:MAG: hypothetical protein GY856_36230 [bacterium]|nr:hypothetical protein [bacterium]